MEYSLDSHRPSDDGSEHDAKKTRKCEARYAHSNQNNTNSHKPVWNEEKMKLAVISDLHLGLGDTVDQFGHDDAEFLKFLDYLEDNFERIVLLGDIYETLASRRPYSQAHELKAVREAHSEIVDRFDGDGPYTYIHGNHDMVAGNLLAVPDQMMLQVDGRRLLFTHGHWFDWIIRRGRFFSEWCAWMGGWIIRFGLQRVFRFFEGIDRLVVGKAAEKGRSKFQRWAVSMARKHEADVIVTGHTHVGTRREHGNRLYLNSGSCSKGKYSFLSLDTAQGDYALHTSW